MKILETHIVPAIDKKIRLQEYAVSIFKQIHSRSALKKAIKRGEILINGETANTGDWIEKDQKIELIGIATAPKKVFRLKLEIIFEDAQLAVINKPAGFPTSGNYFKTIENALPYNLKASKEIDALPYPLPAHRLDNPTNGLLICAKTRKALIKLQAAFQEKQIQKTYTVLVQGSFPRSIIFTDSIEGKPAKTRCELQEKLKIKNEYFSIIRTFPETGRTHQIRIHLSKNGYPIAGDSLYGRPENLSGLSGLYLAATGLQFQHPLDQNKINLELPLPKKFRIIKELAGKP